MEPNIVLTDLPEIDSEPEGLLASAMRRYESQPQEEVLESSD